MNTTIKHVKTNTDGVTEEKIVIEYTDIRWPNSSDTIELSISSALELSRKLEEKLSAIPL